MFSDAFPSKYLEQLHSVQAIIFFSHATLSVRATSIVVFQLTQYGQVLFYVHGTFDTCTTCRLTTTLVQASTRSCSASTFTGCGRGTAAARQRGFIIPQDL